MHATREAHLFGLPQFGEATLDCGKPADDLHWPQGPRPRSM